MFTFDSSLRALSSDTRTALSDLCPTTDLSWNAFMDAAVLTVVARDGLGVPVGFVAVADTGNESLIVDHLLVAPDHRGVGLGRILLGMSTNAAGTEAGSKKLVTTIPVANPTLVSMLSDAGWEAEADSTLFVDGHPHVSWRWQ